MAYDKFLIAPYNSGLRKDLTTWLSPQDSFQRFENVNIFRGKIKKRFGAKLTGTTLTSRTRYLVGTTDGAGTIVATKLPGAIFDTIGQMFSIGDQVFTVKEAGVDKAMLMSSGGGTAIYTTTGANEGKFQFTTVDGHTTSIYWYPAQPIMGITHYELGSVNEHTTYAMDTQFIYKYSGNDWIKDTTFTDVLHGSNKQFFWSANYVGAAAGQIVLFTTNFNSTIGTPVASDDPIYYYNNTLWANFSTYTKFNDDEDYIQSAKIIIAWKNRLLLINTIEKDISVPKNTAYTSRVRFSHNGSPFPIDFSVTLSPTYGHPWLQRRQTYTHDDGAGHVTTYKGDGGGYIDLPIEQEIVSATIIKDRLIIYCERSTWELAYTGSAGLPFVWRSLDTNVGSESTFSTVNFDDKAVTVGTTGIYACNGVDVSRIDKQIPDEVFSFLKTSDGTKRIHGVRDYFNELAYWTILEHEDRETHTYPNKLLVFNYSNSSWSFYDDTITTFGYFEQSTDVTWAAPGTWKDTASWGSYYNQGKSRRIIAGNHKGFLFLIDNDFYENAQVMTIADLTHINGIATLIIPDHNLASGEYIKLTDSNITYGCDGIFEVYRSDADTIFLLDADFAGVYLGQGTITRVSRILMQSNNWNPYVKNGDAVNLAKIDFCVKNTQVSEITVNYDVDTLGFDFIENGENSGANIGNNVLELRPYDPTSTERFKDILWRTIYFQASGDFVNITISMTDEQMLNPDYSLSDFELQGMILYTMKEGR